MLYLGGLYPDDMNPCLRLSGNKSFLEPLFLFYHEETDKLILFFCGMVDRRKALKLKKSLMENFSFCAVYDVLFFGGMVDLRKAFKLKSHDILHYLSSADLSKSFSQLIVSIFIFS